jgi:hypothetical protein
LTNIFLHSIIILAAARLQRRLNEPSDGLTPPKGYILQNEVSGGIK